MPWEPPRPFKTHVFRFAEPFWARGTFSYILISFLPIYHFGKQLWAVVSALTCRTFHIYMDTYGYMRIYGHIYIYTYLYLHMGI